MDIRDYLAVSKRINDCPNCGSSDIGEGKGSVGVLNSMIERTCKCGFKFKYDVDQGTKPKQIRQAIDEALSECK